MYVIHLFRDTMQAPMEAEFGPTASSKPTAGLRSFSKHCNRGYTGSFHSLTAFTACTLVHPLASTTPTHWAGSTGLASQAAAVTTPHA